MKIMIDDEIIFCSHNPQNVKDEHIHTVNTI